MISFFDRLTGSRSLEPAQPRERTGSQTQKIYQKAEDAAISAPTSEEEDGQLTLDIYDEGDNIAVQAFVGGSRPEDIDVEITDDAVTIQGKRMRSHEVKDEHFYYRELYWGKFSRSVILPQEVVSDEAEATMKNGLLTIKLPKRDRHKTQKLRVKSSD